ncbi:MAG: transglycosylase SLT domain-containing protein, partial [Campylobacterota bacterium]
SHIPAFGLMQIVPNSAGKDVNNFLRGQKVAPSSNFLYNPDNSILFGSTYLHILYYRYLSKIKDPQSRIYCVIAAYNTGAGNVARAFTGSNNTSKAARKINTMTPQQVYDHLVKNLPYDETKKYLVKVSDRLSLYADYVKQ